MLLDQKHWVGFWVVERKLWDGQLLDFVLQFAASSHDKYCWGADKVKTSDTSARPLSHTKMLSFQHKTNAFLAKRNEIWLAQKRVHFGLGARGFRWYLGRSPPGAWSWLFRWHSSFGWVGSWQGSRSKFYCSKVAGEEVLAFSRQPIVPHPKDRGRRGFLKRWTPIWAGGGMWDCPIIPPPQILLAVKEGAV